MFSQPPEVGKVKFILMQEIFLEVLLRKLPWKRIVLKYLYVLDKEIQKRKLRPPYLLKLDTHGFEIPILEGAKEIISKAELSGY